MVYELLSDLNSSTNITTVVLYSIILLVSVVIIFLIFIIVKRSRSDNSIFYEEKGAINIRIAKLPDIRIATKHCKNFLVTVIDQEVIISYENPFGGKKEYIAEVVGPPIDKPFYVEFREVEFKKLCFNLKPGNLSFSKNKMTFNYNRSVQCRLKYFKEEKL